MQYYIIHNGNVMIANNPNPLADYGLPVQELPKDYEYGKYIVVESELVLNPNWEEEKQEQEKQRRNSEIDLKIKELNEMAIPDILHGNKKNIELYNEVINSLAECKF